MGYELYREVMRWAPAALTPREKLAALVIADDANDGTRVTWSSVSDPAIMQQAMVPDDRAMRRIITKLKREKVLEHLSGGHNGRAAKYRFLHLAPAGSAKQGENHPATDHVAGQKSPSYSPETPEQGAQNRPATDHVAGSKLPSSRVEITLPTPHPSTTSSSVAEAVGTAEAPTSEEGEEEQQQDTTPEAFLQALPAPWGVGGPTAKAYAPMLAQAIAERHWRLDAALVAELTKNPDGIRAHSKVLRLRIRDLPYRQQPVAKATRTCRDCGEPHPNVADNGLCPPCIRGDTTSQQRHGMPADFRQQLRQARERTSS